MGGNQYFLTPQNDRQSLCYDSSIAAGSKKAVWAAENSNFRKWPDFLTSEVPLCPQGTRSPPGINSQNDPQVLGFLKMYYMSPLLSPEKRRIISDLPYM